MSDILISTTNPQPAKSDGHSALTAFLGSLPSDAQKPDYQKSVPQKDDDMDLSSFFLG